MDAAGRTGSTYAHPRDAERRMAMLTATLALAAALRMLLLGQNSIWLDEAVVVRATQTNWGDLFGLLQVSDAHPPLYYVLVKAWVSVAGTSEVALRLPSVVFSVASVALTFMLARRVCSNTVSLLAAFLLSVSPFQIMAGQEARMYPLLEVLVLASTLALVAATERGGLLRWAAYALAATLMVYTHYLSFLVLAAHGLWVLLTAPRQLGRWLLGIVAAAILFLPWEPSLWFQAHHIHDSTFYVNANKLLDLTDVLGLTAFGGSLVGMAGYLRGGRLGGLEQVIVLLPFLGVLGFGIRALARRDLRGLALVGLPLVVPVGAMLGLSIVRPMFVPRWFSFLGPFYCVVLAEGIVAASAGLLADRARAIAGITAGLVLYSVPMLTAYYLSPDAHPFRWREAAQFVERRMRPEDYIVYVTPAKLPFTYYFHHADPSLTLTPREEAAVRGGRPFDATWAHALARTHPRVWLVASLPLSDAARARLFGALETSYRIVDSAGFGGANIFELQASGATGVGM